MSKSVLIVDDSSIMRKMIKTILTEGGHTISGEAKTGEEAVELYRTLKPDLVTMDITMRGMDGFAAAREILRHDGDAQIIFLSNLDEDSYAEDAMRIGAKGYVGKRDTREILTLIENS
jgi:two-component system chemotaxis response regulator CheY